MAKKTTAGAGKIPQKKKSFKDVCKENIGFFFILPWLFGFLAFKFYPMASSLNYIDVFTTRKIVTALKVTFKYAFITVPLKLVFALFIAYILNFKIKGVNFFRTAYYIPSILGGSVAIAVL